MMVSDLSHDLLLISHNTHDTGAGHTLPSPLSSHLSHSFMVTTVTWSLSPGAKQEVDIPGGKRRLFRAEAKID